MAWRKKYGRSDGCLQFFPHSIGIVCSRLGLPSYEGSFSSGFSCGPHQSEKWAGCFFCGSGHWRPVLFLLQTAQDSCTFWQCIISWVHQCTRRIWREVTLPWACWLQHSYRGELIAIVLYRSSRAYTWKSPSWSKGLLWQIYNDKWEKRHIQFKSRRNIYIHIINKITNTHHCPVIFLLAFLQFWHSITIEILSIPSLRSYYW